MRTTSFEQTLPDEGFAQKKLDIFLSPLFRWQRLQEHHDLLEIHLSQLVGPLHEECCTYVKMEGRKPVFFGLRKVSESLGRCHQSTYQVCIPHPYCVLDRDFTHEQAIHPSEAELYELDALVLQMLG